MASGAKFNIGKTNVIPIGRVDFCEEVLQSRKTGPDKAPLPENIHIAKEGEAVQILGAWFGNKIDAEQVWIPVIEKIDTNLARWARNGPTMDGRRAIIQMFVGGMTQFLTVVQGMPNSVEKRLMKHIDKYLWKGKDHNPVSQKVICGPAKKGRRKVLDLKARNEAIKIMWLKWYLDFEERKMWASIADALLAYKVPTSEQNVDPEARINIFLQSWQTYTNKNQLPELKLLVDTARKYGLRIEGIAFSRKILWSMPIWYHRQASPEIRAMNSTAASICLRSKHKIQTVGEVESMANLIQSNSHSQNMSCKCDECEFIRETYACKHPHGCARQAEKLLDTLPPKWDPRSELPEDYQQAPKTNEDMARDVIIFDNCVTTDGTLTDIFRIFTDETHPTTAELPTLRPREATGNMHVTVEGWPKRVLSGTDGSPVGEFYIW